MQIAIGLIVLIALVFLWDYVERKYVIRQINKKRPNTKG